MAVSGITRTHEQDKDFPILPKEIIPTAGMYPNLEKSDFMRFLIPSAGMYPHLETENT